MERIVFGPIPSRRLGQSLGVNNIPHKVCTYSCIYCQVGKTENLTLERKTFYSPERIIEETGRVLASLRERNEKVDYISFVSDGEPTLDLNLGRMISGLGRFGVRIAVITNGSLLWMEDVRRDLAGADLVSVKIDAFSPETWKKINSPAANLDYTKILRGIEKFREGFGKTFLTETLLVAGVNDSEPELKKIAGFLKPLSPSVAYIGIPTRPPAEQWVSPPPEDVVNMAYLTFSREGLKTELILGGVTDDRFGYTGDIEGDILNIISVHPMSRRQVQDLLEKAGGTWETVEKLLACKKAREIEYQGEKYYLKNFKR